MRFFSTFCMATAVSNVAALGLVAYKEILEGRDNSGATAYSNLGRSDTIFLNIQIIAGWDHSNLINDFKTLSRNYGSKGVSVIPRVRYGTTSGDVTNEPSNQDQLLNDVSAWAQVFKDVSGTILIPVIQAGFLGPWGEWHDGPFCKSPGTSDTATNLAVKRSIVEILQRAGKKVALRNPQDHRALFENNRAITLHNDCIFNGGPNGYDGGTFPSYDRQTWIDYTKKVASGNTYGGEGCNQADDSTYDWSNFADLCGSNGLAAYIHTFQIAYLNPGNPAQLQQLVNDPAWSGCANTIEMALKKYM
ncbi:hypothetical protein V8C42DRAFT_337514 [Trichoderma barbatum]